MARVLLIDDDDALREVQAELLGAPGHQTIQAGSGAAGIEAIRSARPDLVLCDVGMPGMDGSAVLEAVRADPQLASTPFCIMGQAVGDLVLKNALQPLDDDHDDDDDDGGGGNGGHEHR